MKNRANSHGDAKKELNLFIKREREREREREMRLAKKMKLAALMAISMTTALPADAATATMTRTFNSGTIYATGTSAQGGFNTGFRDLARG